MGIIPGEIIRATDFGAPIYDFEASNQTALTNTAYEAPASSVGFAFVAPPSGRGLVIVHSRVDINTTVSATRIALTAPRLGTGDTIGAGTAQPLNGQTTPSDNVALDAFAFAVGAATQGRLNAGFVAFAEGLTPGADYNLQLQYRLNAAGSGNYSIRSQLIGWLPTP